MFSEIELKFLSFAGVSFYPSLEPNLDLQSDDFILKRNETFRELIGRINAEDEGLSSSQRDKRETEKRETIIENSSSTTTITSRDEIAGKVFYAIQNNGRPQTETTLEVLHETYCFRKKITRPITK